MNDFKWVEDMDCNSVKLGWDVKHNWYSKRYAKKYEKVMRQWIHPTELIKIISVSGVIERRIFNFPWVGVCIETNVGVVWVSNSVSYGEEVYILEVSRYCEYSMSKEFNKKMNPNHIIKFMNDYLKG